MKLKKMLAICVMALSLLFVTACGGINLSDMPKTQDTVYGNGGLSVTKGDYIYFVNSHTSYNGLTKKDNENGKVFNSAIYRTKLNQGKIEYEENGNPKNCDLVVSKIAGYEYTNLHIFDDYIYYATPNMEYQKDGTLKTSAVDFCRTKLNGSQTDVLYTAKDYDDSSKYEVYKIGSSVYLVVFEKDKIVKVEISNRVKGSVVLASNISSVLMPKVETYEYAENVGISGTQGYIYYVREFNKDQDNAYDTSTLTGNILGRVCIADGKIEERKDHDIKYDLKDLNNDYLFITYGTDIYAVDKSFPLDANAQFVGDIRLTYSIDSLAVSNFYATKSQNGYIYSLDSKTYFVKNVKTPKTYLISDSALTINSDDANFAYTASGTKIERVNLFPKYMAKVKFKLNENATIAGKELNAGDEVKAFTTISQEEFLALTNAIDKAKFELSKSTETLVNDSNIDSKYFDFTKNGEVFYFCNYSSENGETTRPYLKRVVISPENKEVKTDEKTGEIIEPETYADFDLGYKTGLVCPVENGFKPGSSSSEE